MSVRALSGCLSSDAGWVWQLRTVWGSTALCCPWVFATAGSAFHFAPPAPLPPLGLPCHPQPICLVLDRAIPASRGTSYSTVCLESCQVLFRPQSGTLAKPKGTVVRIAILAPQGEFSCASEAAQSNIFRSSNAGKCCIYLSKILFAVIQSSSTNSILWQAISHAAQKMPIDDGRAEIKKCFSSGHYQLT